MIDNYRWRLGLTPGERQYDDLEQQLATGPLITVPTITLEGDANGAPHPDPSAYETKFTGKYRPISGCVGDGHNLDDDAPLPRLDALSDVELYALIGWDVHPADLPPLRSRGWGGFGRR